MIFNAMNFSFLKTTCAARVLQKPRDFLDILPADILKNKKDQLMSDSEIINCDSIGPT